MTKRTDQVNVRLEPEMKEKLSAYANAEKRTLSNLVFLIISEWLQKKEVEATNPRRADDHFPRAQAKLRTKKSPPQS